MTDWQPIETIPDYVMEALLYGELDGDISGRFGYKSRVVGKRDRPGGPWSAETDTYGVDIIASHWMPLPEPPGARE